MTSPSLFRSPLSFLAFAALTVLGVAMIFRTSSNAGETTEIPVECLGLSPQDCAAKLGVEGLSASAEAQDPISRNEGSPSRFLRADEVCVDVGYLCAAVDTDGSLRILRWPEETALIRIWVPEPAGLPPNLAREFQRAAARGFQAWQGHPIPLSIRTRAKGEEPDIEVEWARSVDDGRLGRAGVEWTERAGEVRMRVLSLVLATHEPGQIQRELTPQQIELVAAHEMGHALGLPHSDSPRDVMFHQNTATRLTARDYRTLQALYSFPNGVEIRR